MARGRFISASISRSKKFSRLQSRDHKLMYLMLVPHCDCEGRHDADLRVLAGTVYTLEGFTFDEIEAGMLDLHRVNLVVLYEAGGEPYLEVVDFREHNRIRRDRDGNPTHEASSSIPPIADGRVLDGTSGQLRSYYVVTTESLRSNYVATPAQVEVQVQDKVQDKVQEVQKRTSESARLSDARTPKPEVFKDIWNEERGRLPRISRLNEARRRSLRTLANDLGADAVDLFRDAVRCVARDEFWVERQYGLNNLLRGKVLEKAEKWRAGRSGLSGADTKLATRAESLLAALGEEGDT
jgi:hypothetical protein